MTSPLAPGTRLSRYEILSQLGKGGMGEVYLALDTKLDRTVALKVLPAEAASNQDRMRRFVQEAKAAAALNHPNIAHIYEIEEAAGLNFIAMEYIVGKTLHESIHGRPTDLKKHLGYLQQVAEGLITAHAAGVVHRDLKPDNIMITRDGYAKILDFGLAKLVEPQSPGGHSDDRLGEAVTRDLRQHSRPGAVMGTVGYMSPEQARGQTVDQRSDIFAFGCILYESATGQQPFAGDSDIDSLHKIIYDQPPPIKDLNADAPPELQRIIRRCLMKEPEKRYQTIRDIANDLEDLRRELDSETEPQRPARPSETGKTTARAPNQATTVVSHGPAPTVEISAAQSVSSAQYILDGIKQHKRVTVLALMVLMVVLVAGGYGIFKLINKTNATLPFHEMRMTRLTNSGKTASAAISPDGKYVVYVLVDGENQSLWLKHVATMSDTQIVSPAEILYSAPTFSPDGDFVYYIQSPPNNRNGVLYRVPVLGGPARKVIEGAAPLGITFSPDGKRLAVVRPISGGRLIVANADGTGERLLAIQHSQSWFGKVAWSPDGNVIAALVGNYTKGGFYMNVIAVSASGGEQQAISSPWPVVSTPWPYISGIAWLADGSGMIISARNQTSNPVQIWQLSYPTGKAHRITNDLNSYSGASLTLDSNALVTVQSRTTSNIWIVPSGDEGAAKQIIAGGRSPSWTPDDKITYDSNSTGKQDIWLAESDGTGQKQISFESNDNVQPLVTPDNRYIVFGFWRDGRPYIGRMDRHGGNPKPLTTDLSGLIQFHISPDSQWVIYTDPRKGGLWKVSIDGGEATELVSKYQQFAPAVSPDGKLIACYDLSEGALRIVVVPFASVPAEGGWGGGSRWGVDGQPMKTFAAPVTQAYWLPLRWTVDGKAVVYINTLGDVSNLWSQSLDGGPPKQLTHFTSEQIWWFDWSRDGKQLALARGTNTRDAILIRNLHNTELKQPGD